MCGRQGRWLRQALAWFALVTLALLVTACGPEATRTRGGGPGADIGNKGHEVQLHPRGPGAIYYLAPREGAASQLAGMPVE